jgi:hypothetical protein
MQETLATRQTKTAHTHTHTYAHDTRAHNETQKTKKMSNTDPIEKIILRITQYNSILQ